MFNESFFTAYSTTGGRLTVTADTREQLVAERNRMLAMKGQADPSLPGFIIAKCSEIIAAIPLSTNLEYHYDKHGVALPYKNPEWTYAYWDKSAKIA